MSSRRRQCEKGAEKATGGGLTTSDRSTSSNCDENDHRTLQQRVAQLESKSVVVVTQRLACRFLFILN